MDTDGGREVHALHVALSAQGYNCGDDDMRWWMFGDTTVAALKTFQVRSNWVGGPKLCRAYMGLMPGKPVPQQPSRVVRHL